MRTREKSKLGIVKEIEARKPKELTYEYSVEYWEAIGWMLMSVTTEEEAARYFTAPGSIEAYYQKTFYNVKRYIREHFDENFDKF